MTCSSPAWYFRELTLKARKIFFTLRIHLSLSHASRIGLLIFSLLILRTFLSNLFLLSIRPGSSASIPIRKKTKVIHRDSILTPQRLWIREYKLSLPSIKKKRSKNKRKASRKPPSHREIWRIGLRDGRQDYRNGLITWLLTRNLRSLFLLLDLEVCRISWMIWHTMPVSFHDDMLLGQAVVVMSWQLNDDLVRLHVYNGSRYQKQPSGKTANFD